MNETSDLLVLGLGLVLGLRHALDPDHIVAVTTFIGEQQQIRRACRIGLFWGMGHTIALSTAGLFVVGLKVPMSKWLAERLEFGVCIMLIVLGVRLITNVHRRWHSHDHSVDWQRSGLRPLIVGIVHGAAGSATLTLLVLSTISSTFHALLYILLFGIGSMAGMLLVSLLISIPVKLAGERLSSAVLPIQMGTGILSCAFGLYLGVTIWSRLAS